MGIEGVGSTPDFGGAASFDAGASPSMDREAFDTNPTLSRNDANQEDKFYNKQERMKMMWSSHKDRMEKLINSSGWNKIVKENMDSYGFATLNSTHKSITDIVGIGRRLS